MLRLIRRIECVLISYLLVRARKNSNRCHAARSLTRNGFGSIFMESLRTGVARTEVFRVHSTSFEAAVDIALNAEFNFKAARFGTHGYNPNSANSFGSFNRPEPMDLSLAETEEEAELRAIEQH